MERRFINPLELSVPINYSHVAVASAGRTVYVSGQIALDATGRIVGAGDLRAQAVQVYENLRAALDAAGASFADVIKMTTFVVGLDPERTQVLREVRAQFLPAGHKPASTMVGVASLVRPELLVEVEMIAALADRR
ncbi:MAG: RidA family protein [Burkholderiales bacterium]